MMGLTQRMEDCLRFLEASIAARGYAPSMEEICDGIGLSHTSKARAATLVRCLEERGAIRIQRTLGGKLTHRGITLVHHNCPHCGGSLDKIPERAAA